MLSAGHQTSRLNASNANCLIFVARAATGADSAQDFTMSVFHQHCTRLR
jgi:hypothetical protein